MNSNLGQFLIEATICLLASGLTVAILLQPLRRLLVEVCGTRERAGFWVAYSSVMLFIAPLMTVVVFGKSGRVEIAEFGFYKAALGSALFGLFVALAAIGWQIAKFLPKQSVPGDEGLRAVAPAGSDVSGRAL